MRMTRCLVGASVLTLLLCGSIALAQSVPPTAVPFITQVTPPSLPPGTNPSNPSNFTLTILGANFTSNDTVSLAPSPSYVLHSTTTTVNATGSQITAQFSNTVLGSPATLAVTVTNPAGTPPSSSNTYYLPFTPAQPSVALNQNTTSFLSGTPKGMVAADFFGNGSPGLAVVSQSSSTVSILTSNFGGPITLSSSYPTGNQPWGIVAAYLLGSNYPDLAITNSMDNTVTILFANGGGTYRQGALVSLPGVYPTQIVAGDFNGDGKIDLAVLDTCGPAPTNCQVAAPGPGSVTILLNNGDGTFSVSPAALTTGHNPYAMATADLNGDGLLDLVVANQKDNNLSIFMGNGDGTFTPANASPATGNVPSAIAIGDFNGDGNLDLAITNSSDNTVSILLNQNCSNLPAVSCTFAPAAISPQVGSSPSSIATADMNADGFLDLVVANYNDNSVTILVGDGTGAFNLVLPQTQFEFSTGQYPQSVVLADFNLDGRLDIVTCNGFASFTYLRQAAVPQLALSPSNYFPYYGTPVQFNVSLIPPFGQPTPTGTVTFYSGSTPIGTVPLNGYQANFAYPGLNVGTQQVTAVYNGDSNFTSATSNAVSETVAQTSTTTTLSADVLYVPYGSPFTLTAAVQSQFGGVATGTITFHDGNTGADLGDVSLNNNTAQLTLSKLAPGTYAIFAFYPGDGNVYPSISQTVTVTVTQTSTTTTVSTNLTQAQFAQTVTFTATIQPAGSNSPTGTVGFYDGSTLLGTSGVSNGSATFSTTVLTLGNHVVSAKYSGDSNFLSSSGTTSVIVTKSSTSTTVSTNLTPSTYGQSVTFSATVTPAFGSLPSGQVSFYDGTNLLGTANTTTGGAAQITVPGLTGGTHAITAQWVQTFNYAASTSNAITQTVTPAASATSISAVPNPSSYGQRVTVTVTVDSTYHYISNGGTVTLFDNGTAFAFENIQGGTAVFPISTLIAGVHSLTANYAGDSNLTGSSSTAYTQTINQATTTTTVVLSSYSTLFGQSVTVTASVASPSTLPETGTVSFFDGSTLVGATPVSGARAQYTASTWSPGTHTITAQYNGDANFVGSATTQSQALTVSKDPTLTTVSVDVNPSTYGQTVTLTAAVQLQYGSGASGSVTFLDGTVPIGTAAFANGGARLAVSTLSGGSHSITAQYSGDASFASSTSTAITETVNPAPTSTTVTSATNPSNFGQAVTLTATVQPPAGTTASGSVTFVDGPFGIGTATLTNNTAQLTVSFLAPGSHTITAVYGGNVSLSGSTSAALTETIHQAATTVTVTSNLNPAPFGQCVQLSATVQPASGTTKATGTVTFFDGTVSLGSGTLANNAATLSYCTFQGGAHTITANYSGDTNYLASISAALTETVNPVSSSVTIASSQNPVAYGSTVTFTATVLPSVSGGTATGSVTFFDGANSLGTANLSNDSAQLTVSNLSQGAHSLTVKYNGDSNFASSTSSALTQTISQASTATTLASGLNPANFAQSITFAVSVQPSAGSTPTGTVTLMDGAISLASGTLSGAGSALITVGGLSAGSHSITAVYGGDVNFTSSTSAALVETVNAASTTTTISSSANPSAFHQTITFTAVVQPPAGTTATGSVTFMDGSTSLGSAALSSNSAQLTLSALTTGTHAITAVYSGNANLSASTSAALSQVVNAASTTTSVTSSQTPSAFGQSVTFTATIQTAFGSSPTGTVTFLDGAATLATVSVSGNAAQLSLSGLSLGSHSITAKYNGDPNFTASTSASFAQSVTQAATATNVTSNSNPSSYGQSVTFSASVSPAYTGTPTGTVTFFDGGTSLGSAGLSGGVATLTTAATSLLAGSHSITANYNGDSNFLASASAAFTQIVNPAATSTTLSSSANSSAAGKSVTFTANVSSSVTGTLTGTVNFYLDGGTTPIASSSLSAGSAHFSTSSLGAGFHTFTAAFVSSNSNFSGSTSASLMQSITDFTITASPSSNTISRGSSGTYTLTLTPLGGLTGNVSLTCSGAPSNGSCAISPSTVTLDGTNPAQAIVTVTVNHNAGTGTRTLTFKGTAGTTTHSTTVTLHIN